MANQETQFLDDVIAKSRRKMLTVGLTSLAGVVDGALAPAAKAAAFTDADILNFALNLEYLEANFYYLAAFGTTIDIATGDVHRRRRTDDHTRRAPSVPLARSGRQHGSVQRRRKWPRTRSKPQSKRAST